MELSDNLWLWLVLFVFLLISKQTPKQRHQIPHCITLYRNLLVSYSDTSNIESLEFPFHTRSGRGESIQADRGEAIRWQRHGGKSQRTVGLRGKYT